MNKHEVIQKILKGKSTKPKQEKGTAFAPANIALCKYWGKQNQELNLPTTPSLSISLGTLGAKTTLFVKDNFEESSRHPIQDSITVNGLEITLDSVFAQNLIKFLDLFRETPSTYFGIETAINLPIGAGLASSACGFAAVVKALDILFGWELPTSQLSVLGRLGSGSASRSFWHGFVEWQLGKDKDGLTCFGVPLEARWPELRIGLLVLDAKQKALSSREGMQRTVQTSSFYSHWTQKHALDFGRLKRAIDEHNFIELGETAESNALAMHALMLTSWPPILYSGAATVETMTKIWEYRKLGLSVFFTQDAGPNLKLLFLEKDLKTVCEAFPRVQVIAPFAKEFWDE